MFHLHPHARAYGWLAGCSTSPRLHTNTISFSAQVFQLTQPYIRLRTIPSAAARVAPALTAWNSFGEAVRTSSAANPIP